MKSKKQFLIASVLVVIFLILNVSGVRANDNSDKIILPKDGIFNFRNYPRHSKFYSRYYKTYSKYSPYLEYYMINYLYKDKISYEYEDEKHSSYIIKIQGDENNIVRVTDSNEDGDSWARYDLIGYFEDINSFVFEYGGYEWGGVWIVNTVTGKETFLDGMPEYFRPDGKHFAVVMTDNDLGYNGIYIYEINENGELNSITPKEPFYEKECYHGCEIIGWRDNKIFVNFERKKYHKEESYSDFIVESEEDEYIPSYYESAGYKLPLFLKESSDEKESALKDVEALVLDYKNIKEMIDSDENNNLKDYF